MSDQPPKSKQEFNVAVEESGTPSAPNNATSSTSMIITLGSVAMMSGLLVVLTWLFTLEPIKKNKQEMIEKSIFNVIPGAVQRQTYLLYDNGVVLIDENKPEAQISSDNKKPVLKFYAGFDAKGELKGIASESGAQGYADMVSLIYGYDHKCECIRGFNIIKMAETPGLGDKILTDEKFLANFDALDAKVAPNKQSLVNPITPVKSGTKSNPWEVDAISGATITSKAVAKAIDINAQELLPRIQAYIKDLSMPITLQNTIPSSKEEL